MCGSRLKCFFFVTEIVFFLYQVIWAELLVGCSEGKQGTNANVQKTQQNFMTTRAMQPHKHAVQSLYTIISFKVTISLRNQFFFID